MRRRTGVILILVAFCLGAVIPVGAQSGWEGVFVTPPNGGVWLIIGTQKRQVQLQSISQDDFDRFETGDSVAGAWQLGQATSSAAPQSSAPAPAAPPPPAQTASAANPGASLIGQSVRVCSAYKQPLQVTVEAVEYPAQFKGKAPGGVYLAAVVRAENLGTDKTVAGSATALQDERGRTFGEELMLIFSTDPLAVKYQAVQSATDIAPGTAKRVILVYDTAADSRSFSIGQAALYAKGCG